MGTQEVNEKEEEREEREEACRDAIRLCCGRKGERKEHELAEGL